MSRESAFDYLKSKIAEERTRAAHNVLSGKVSPTEYNRLCGVIQGLDYTTALIDDLAKRMEEDNE